MCLLLPRVTLLTARASTSASTHWTSFVGDQGPGSAAAPGSASRVGAGREQGPGPIGAAGTLWHVTCTAAHSQERKAHAEIRSAPEQGRNLCRDHTQLPRGR